MLIKAQCITHNVSRGAKMTGSIVSQVHDITVARVISWLFSVPGRVT